MPTIKFAATVVPRTLPGVSYNHLVFLFALSALVCIEGIGLHSVERRNWTDGLKKIYNLWKAEGTKSHGRI